jgi:spore germination protein
MIIHVVQPEETIYTISEKYKIPVITIIQENGITNPDNLVIGQTIVIIYPKTTHTVRNGESLASIASKYGVSVMELLRNNPNLSDRELLVPGETIVISYDTNKTRKTAIGGYAYPYIDRNILRKTLPYLTYITIFNYRGTSEAELVDIDDSEIVQISKSYGVAPMMLLSTLSETGVGSGEVASRIYRDEKQQDKLFSNVINMVKLKGYAGVNLYVQYLRPENREQVENYVIRFSNRLHSEGYRFVITVTPRTNIERTTVEIEKIDYSIIAKAADAILIASYEWGYSFGPPASVAPVNIVKEILNHVVSNVPSDKVTIGLPIVGYDWQLPYIPGASRANAITSTAAIELAVANEVSIKYSEVSQAPYFFYTSVDNQLHIVWFKDARSVDVISGLVEEYNLQGMTVWNITYFYTQMWFVINNKYEIDKVLDQYKI